MLIPATRSVRIKAKKRMVLIEGFFMCSLISGKKPEPVYWLRVLAKTVQFVGAGMVAGISPNGK